MKRHGNLWSKITAWDNILEAYNTAKRGKRNLSGVRRFKLHEEQNLRDIQKMLEQKTFTTSSYSKKFVYDPKFRTIYTLPFNPDRVVQHALMRVLEPIWDNLLIEYAYSCRKNKGVIAGHARTAQIVRRNKYCLKCDISKFYPSINHDIMMQVVERKIKCPDTLWLIRNIIYSFPGDKNVPIGNYTSQWLSNLYMDFMDQRAVHKWKVDYARYCDDFIFLSNDKELLNQIKAELPNLLWQERKLTLSKLDLFQTARGIDYLGYRFFHNGNILLRKRTAKALKKRMKRILLAIENGEDPVQYRSSVAAALGTLKHCNSYNLRQTLQLPRLVKLVGIRTKFPV